MPNSCLLDDLLILIHIACPIVVELGRIKHVALVELNAEMLFGGT